MVLNKLIAAENRWLDLSVMILWYCGVRGYVRLLACHFTTTYQQRSRLNIFSVLTFSQDTRIFIR
jgi:hypothetical protein